MSQQTVSAVLALRNLILSGALAPKQRLTEVALAARIGVSRTPLRAALGQLAAEGLLEPVAQGGYAVRAFTERDVSDAIELRGTLEGMAARLAAERGADAEALRRLRKLLGRIDRLIAHGEKGEHEFQAYVELNRDFHAGLAALAHSTVIGREIERVNALPFASPNAFVLAQSQTPEGWAVLVVAQSQHHAVVDAIAGREGARAEAIMREHARIARRNLDNALRDDERGNHMPFTLIAGGRLIARP